MKHSIYTSAYNLINMGFDWRSTLDNWGRFLGGEGQVIIAANASTDDTVRTLHEYAHEQNEKGGTDWGVVETNISYENPLFDGMIKNEALKRCTGNVCTLLDMDEVLPLSNRAAWDMAKTALMESTYDALFVPVIDLFHDEKHFKSMGQKWYLHKNKSYLKRGRVNFAAREDGSTDITKSDTCELCREDGSLANATAFVGAQTEQWLRLMTMSMNQIPYVIHLGWLNKQQRLRQSAFWAPVWNSRAGEQVEKPLAESDLDKISYYPHNLKHWNEG